MRVSARNRPSVGLSCVFVVVLLVSYESLIYGWVSTWAPSENARNSPIGFSRPVSGHYRVPKLRLKFSETEATCEYSDAVDYASLLGVREDDLRIVRLSHIESLPRGQNFYIDWLDARFQPEPTVQFRRYSDAVAHEVARVRSTIFGE